MHTIHLPLYLNRISHSLWLSQVSVNHNKGSRASSIAASVVFSCPFFGLGLFMSRCMSYVRLDNEQCIRLRMFLPADGDAPCGHRNILSSFLWPDCLWCMVSVGSLSTCGEGLSLTLTWLYHVVDSARGHKPKLLHPGWFGHYICHRVICFVGLHLPLEISHHSPASSAQATNRTQAELQSSDCSWPSCILAAHVWRPCQGW